MFELGPLAINIGITFGTSMVIVLAAFAVGVTTGKHRVIDVCWGISFAVVAITGLALSTGHGADPGRWLVTALTVTWGLRLSAHIAWRGRGRGDDPRYERLLDRARSHRNWYALRMIYLLQGLSLWFISWPVQVAQYNPRQSNALFGIGIVAWAVGLFFETVGDAQLARFSADPSNKKKVLASGLWHYTRHPNYFGDSCVWWGLWLFAADSWLGLATVVCPLAMTYLLLKRTGKPLLEAHLASTRPGYAEYMRRTSGFVPLPPR